VVNVQMSREAFSRLTTKKKKKKIVNQMIVFGIAWNCENTFVFLPHKLMLFTFMCDSQSLIKLHKKQYRMPCLSVCTFR